MQHKNKYNFYFTYNPFTIKNALQILQNGNIRKCKYLIEKNVCDEQIMGERVGYVYFDDLLPHKKHYSAYSKYQFIINPKILEDMKIEFRILRGFGRGFIINPTDNEQIFNDKIQLIKDMIIWHNGYKGYEIVFSKNIDIKRYVTTVICNKCTDDEYNKIKNIITTKKYNIKLVRMIGNAKNYNVFPSKNVLH
jgi:hypothetical protein